MRILWVKANKLLPVSSGGDIRSYHIARGLASRHELTFLSYYGGARDQAYEAELKSHFPDCVTIPTGGSASPLARAAGYLSRAFQPEPYAVSRFECAEVRRFIADIFTHRAADVAVCDFLDAAVNFPQQLSIPSVLFQHNVESEIWRRHAETASNPLKRVLYNVEYRKMLAYERQSVSAFHHVIAVSNHDALLMSQWTEKSRISVVPTGVDLDRFHPDPGADPAGPVVVFIGAMDWEPNVDAAEHFCREIWPRIQASVPAARFRLVGRNPDRRVQRLASASVEVTGFVSSVTEHLRQAAVVVVPLRIGGGTRLKIYEAMAAGKAVVSTAIGAEGLDVRPGHDIVFADEPPAFAQAVVELLNNPETRSRYERRAAETAARFGWPAISACFERVLERAHAAQSGREVCAVAG